MFRWTVLACCVFIVFVHKVNCSICSTNCQTCSNNDGGVAVCTSCNDGYWLSGSSCHPCPDNCDTCFNSFACETCKPGFHSPSLSCSSPCLNNCLNGICDETTGFCSACPSDRYGYYCQFDCRLCKGEQCDLTKCTDGCKSGYWQYQNQDHFECKVCKDNCASCNTLSICDVCNDGAYLDSQNYCLPCRPTCKSCSSVNKCSACAPGYVGVACDFPCSSIITHCLLCDGNSNPICSRCEDGFTLQGNECVTARCPNNCESCTEDNVCEICKTGWYGALCDKSCHDIPHCVACQDTGGSILCNTCKEGFIVLDADCTTNSTKLPPTSPAFAQTQTPNKTSNAGTAASECHTTPPSFQTSTFSVGLVTGLGICICTILVVGLVWFLRRRRRLQKPATSRHNAPFYENSVTAIEPNPTSVSSHDPKSENIQEMHVVTENVSEYMEDNRQAPVYEESELTSTDIEQHDYTSLNVRQGEHIYKDLTAI